MQSGFAWGAFVGALVGSVVAFVVVALIVRGWLERRLAALGGVAARPAEAPATSDAALADVAPELVTLARAATDSAIRSEELNDWHRPSMTELGSDDVSDIIRGKLRRASFAAVAARAALAAAVRRHRAALPASLANELTDFCERLESNGNGATSGDRKRRLGADLDVLEARIRDALGSDHGVLDGESRSGYHESTHTTRTAEAP